MQINTLVEDIYSRLENKKPIDEEHMSAFLKGIESAIRDRFEKESDYRPSLRMSAIGRPLRRIWLDIKDTTVSHKVRGSNQIKFLYGNILEELLLLFVKEAGHSVSGEQKEVNLSGVKGHIDCLIDGELVDIKSASDFSFRKFKTGSLMRDDSFGYIGQLSGYAEALGLKRGFFLAINKTTGELTLLEVDDFDMINANKRIETLKSALDSEEIPKECYAPVADGKSGNLQLAKDCIYCPFKFRCWPDTRVFKYSNGLRYLTTVVKEPQVEDVTEAHKKG